MFDYETFLTQLYVMTDDFCKQQLAPEAVKRGKKPCLSRSEVVTLAVAGQWSRFGSERGFCRYADKRLRGAFPSLPGRERLNRLMRQHEQAIVAFTLFVAETIGRKVPYEAIDASAVPTRNNKRRGRGWLPGMTSYGKSNRIGFFEGLHLLISTTPLGVITGFGFGSGNTKDITLAETFLAARHNPHHRLAAVGKPAYGDYVADKGFSADTNQARWRDAYGANVITAPRSNSKTRVWPKGLRRWLASLRQIVETVFEKLHNMFRLSSERPHDLTGFQMRLAAKAALHNFCIYLNLQNDRNPLAFVDLVDWD